MRAEIAGCQLAWFPAECKSDFCDLPGSHNSNSNHSCPAHGLRTIQHLSLSLPSLLTHSALAAARGECCSQPQQAQGESSNSTFLFSRLKLWKNGSKCWGFGLCQLLILLCFAMPIIIKGIKSIYIYFTQLWHPLKEGKRQQIQIIPLSQTELPLFFMDLQFSVPQKVFQCSNTHR